jgi:hypothetical protein
MLFPMLSPFPLAACPCVAQTGGVSGYLRLLLPLEARRWLTESALRDRRSPEDQALVLLIDTLKRRRSLLPSRLRRSKMNLLASVLSNHVPDGFQLEIREGPERRVTTFRYTRIADGVWCQQVVEHALIEQAISVDALAFDVLRDVERKFFGSDKANND